MVVRWGVCLFSVNNQVLYLSGVSESLLGIALKVKLGLKPVLELRDTDEASDSDFQQEKNLSWERVGHCFFATL